MIESGVATVYEPPPRLGSWHKLVRTEIPGRPAAILGGFTGAILCLTLVALLIGSVVTFIAMFSDGRPEAYARYGRTRSDEAMALFWVVLAIWHFAAGLVVVCAKLKFWQLQLLATIVNVPVVMCLVKYQAELGLMQHFIFGYLDLWLLFLLARWRPTYKLLAFLNEEIHYYLID